ncbi:MAG: DUF5686 family protein [Bacteroidales bacterium]|nr:DUF5686 family protein [Bacteroidales bacterium]
MIHKYLYLLLFSIFLTSKVFADTAAQTIIKGTVTDSLSGDVLPYVSVYLKGTTIGAMTDDDGKFTITTTSSATELTASSLGYQEKTIKIKTGTTNNVKFVLAPTSYEMAEVVIKPTKEKYSKKNNPAVEFIKKVIDARDENDPKNHEYYQNEQYEKMTFALNNFSEEQKKKWLFKKFQFIFNYVDTSEVSGKPILTLSIKEKLKDYYFRNSPKSEKELVKAVKRSGIDEMFSQESLQQFLNEVFKDINIFENNIPLFLNRFVSPLSTMGPSFYKYYIEDTVMINDQKCMDMTFVPFSSESFGFTGHIYVTLDSTYFVKRIKLNVPKDINLNFVEHMTIEQDFDRADDGTRLITRDDITVEFKIVPGGQGLYARRVTTYRNHSFEPPEVTGVFDTEEKVITEDDAMMKSDMYWADNRHEPIKSKENAVEKLMKQLREVPAFYYTEKVISVLVTGYIPTAKEKSKFDFGPMNTTISGNALEGARFRVGGLTTAYLNKHLFGKGYVAFGTKDKKVMYSAQAEYSFKPKKEHANEFPIHSIRGLYSYDINQLGQHYLYTNMDNIFLALKRQRDDKITYLRKAELSYNREHHFGLSYGVDLRFKKEYATEYVPFKLKGNDGNIYPVKDYTMSELEFRVRYAPNEKFYQTKGNRYPITLDAPIFTLSHTVGVKGILGAQYNYNRTEFGFQKRFWFSAFGYTDIILKTGKVWDKVPYPMLLIPNANLSYTIQYESYATMNAMEFINDFYASWDVTYFGNGILFNRIPLLKYLKWREVLSFRGLYGHLSYKNNPLYNDGVFVFPNGTYEMGKMPFMEAGVGIENIFKILRIDYVWRLTYRDHPNINKGGVRISLHFTF